jgi:colicin import membrane protein
VRGRKSVSRWPSVSLSVLLHASLVAVLVGVWWWNRSEPVEQRLGIEARVVMPGGTPPPAPVAEPEPQPEAPPPEPVPSPEEIAAEQARKEAEAEAAHVSEQRRLAEQREVAELQARQESERQAREKADKERAEKQRLEKEKAEREKLAREKQDRERLQKEQAEKARVAREAELNALLEADRRQATARDSTQMRQYIAQIANRIERAWIRPASARAGLECEVQVTQIPNGTVTDVKIGRCNGDDSVRQSLEAAVYRASPLPLPSDPALFERSLVVTFRPE